MSGNRRRAREPARMPKEARMDGRIGARRAALGGPAMAAEG